MSSDAAPLVSVVMAVYNGAEFLGSAVESILNQTFDDFEFLILNDGSTDDSADILKRFSDPRIKLHENPKNEGLTRCLIQGCNDARGKYIARMDADDISYPTRFEKQVSFLEANPEYAVVGAQSNLIDSTGKRRKISDVPCSHDEIKQALEVSPAFTHGTVVFVRKHIEALGGYRKHFRYSQDYDLWLRVIEKHRVANLPEVLYDLRYHSEAISQKKFFLQSQYANIAREFAWMRARVGSDPIMRGETADLESEIKSWDMLEMNPKVRAENSLKLARRMIRWARFSDVWALWLDAVRVDPLNRKTWAFLHYLLSRRLRRAIRKKL